MFTHILDAGDLSTRAYGLIQKFSTVYRVSYDIRTAKLMNSKKTFSRATHCEPIIGILRILMVKRKSVASLIWLNSDLFEIMPH